MMPTGQPRRRRARGRVGEFKCRFMHMYKPRGCSTDCTRIGSKSKMLLVCLAGREVAQRKGGGEGLVTYGLAGW